MAITRVATLSGTAFTDGANCAINVSTLSIQNGDVLVVGCATTASLADLDISATADESGSLTEAADLFANAFTPTNLWVGYAVQGATPDNTIAVASAYPLAYIVVQYRGASLDDVAATTATGVGGTTADGAAITPVSPGSRVILFCAAPSSIAWSAPANINNFIQQTRSSTRIATGDADWTSGAFDPDPVTGGSGGANASWAAVTLVIKPTPTLTAPLLTNGQTFYAPTISQGGVSLTADLFTDSQSFSTQTLVAGHAVALDEPPTETQTFFESEAIGPAWRLAKVIGSWSPVMPSGFFDGRVFDLDIFDALGEFDIQTTADPNWTRQT